MHILSITNTCTFFFLFQYGVKIFVMTSFKDTCCIEILPNFQKPNRGKNPVLSIFCENGFCLIFLARCSFTKTFLLILLASPIFNSGFLAFFILCKIFCSFSSASFTWHHAVLGNIVEP